MAMTLSWKCCFYKEKKENTEAVWTETADDTTCLLSTTRYWDAQHRLTVLSLGNIQVQQRPTWLVGAEESQASY